MHQFIQDAFLAALADKATESMVQDGRKMLSYKDVAATVAQVPCLDFLEDIVPKKVTAASLAAAHAAQGGQQLAMQQQARQGQQGGASTSGQ